MTKGILRLAASLLLLAVCVHHTAGADEKPAAPSVRGAFADVTKGSGVGEAVARHYERHPKWWLSGLNLVDLDGDGRLDLFLAAHGAGRSLALLNDGHGHFREAPGSYPPTEIHLACDINEDGKLADLVVIDGDPLKDMQAMRRIEGVMLNGRWIDPAGNTR